MIANVYRSQIHMDKRETYNYREISLAKNKTLIFSWTIFRFDAVTLALFCATSHLFPS